MSPLEDNATFWHADTAHIAVNPNRPHDADGLAEFAASSDETRSLLYFQTSGSEGAPKWVGLSRAAFLHSARTVNAHLESTAQDRWLIALPLYHVGGFSILARCHESGASFHRMEEKWSPERFVALCRQENITLASLVPTQVYDLVKAKLEAPDGLRAVVVGGGALAESLGDRAAALGWPLLQSYGMTEACSQIATEPLEHLNTGFDPDSLEVLPGWKLETDRSGTLFLRGPALASGYASKRDWRHRPWIAEDAKPKELHEERGHLLWNWDPIDAASGLITRDRVDLWWHGNRQFLRFIGRTTAIVKILGEMVNVSVLQAKLQARLVTAGLSLTSAFVIARPDERKGSRLLLVGEHPRRVLELLRDQFNKDAIGCERLDEVRDLPALPRTALGKVDFTALQTMLEE